MAGWFYSSDETESSASFVFSSFSLLFGVDPICAQLGTRCVHTCIRIQGRQRIGVVLYAYHTRAPAHFREYHELEVSRSGGATAPPLGLDGVDLISSSFRFGFRF